MRKRSWIASCPAISSSCVPRSSRSSAGNLSRVVYVSYGNPALAAPGTPCPGGRDGFDVHPAFGADGERLRQAVDFVSQRFLPGIKALARCEDGRSCRDPATERMTFVDAHQPAFGCTACARAPTTIPRSIGNASSGKGETFESSLTKGATDPMACGYPASEFRPYASRARWIRTANDSYFTAMTYPEGLPSLLQPSRPARRHLGDLRRGVWRRHPSHRRRPRRHGGRRAAGGARGARRAGADRAGADRSRCRAAAACTARFPASAR